MLVFVAFATAAPLCAEEDGNESAPSASPSVSIAPARGSTQIAHPAGRKWKLGERACNDGGKCGTVRMVTRDYAVVEIDRAKAKAPPKRPKKRREDEETDEEPPPPPRSNEPEPPSGFSNAPAEPLTDAPMLLPEASPGTPGVITSPVRRPKKPGPLRVEPPKPKKRELHPWWAHFQLNVAGSFREDGTKQFTPEVSWNPTFSFDGSFRLRANLGLTTLKTDLNEFFLVVEPAVFASFGGGVFRIEPGAGMQFWVGQGAYPLLQLNLVVSFEGHQDTPKFFERLFLGPAVVFSPVLPTFFAKAGLGFAF